MDPGTFDFRDLIDGPGQFPLKRSLIVDVLGKGGHPQFCIVKNFKPDPTAPGDPLGCQLHPGLIYKFLGD